MATADGGFRIRSAAAQDALAVAACVNAAYQHYVARLGKPPGPMLEDYTQVIAQRQVSVAERNGAIVGVLVLVVTDEGLLLDNVAVHPSCQGSGIGKALLELAEAEARQQGHGSIYLYTHEKMVENLSRYAKFGYVEFARRTEKGYARVYMRKTLA